MKNFLAFLRGAAVIAQTEAALDRHAERRIARQVESERQRKSYADRRAAECRAARLRFTGEQA